MSDLILLMRRRRRAPLRLISRGSLGPGALPGAAIRASVGSYVAPDEATVLYATENVPRFQGAPRRLLMEPPRQSIFRYSQDFAQSAWILQNGPAKSATNGLAPDGTASALALQFGGAGNSQMVQAIGTPANGTWTISAWARAPVEQTFRFKIYNASSDVYSTGIRVTPEWQRYFFTFTSNFGASNAGVANAGGGGARQVEFWGMQLEQGASASSYIPTGADAATRAMDVLNFAIPSAQQRGTVVGTAMFPADTPASAYLGLFCLDSGGNTNRSYIAKEVGGNTIVFGRAGTGGGQFNMATIQPGVPFPYAIGWDVVTGAVRASIAGSPVQGFTGTTLANRFLIGNGHPGLNSPASAEFGIHDLYPGVLLPDEQLQALRAA
ncbi:carbohydrate binding domain-containing protein [Pararoseomonas sp. SCSIO 73927]|uniref:phage head spike fiber domain-containing protein n=1 Tax=Pararoseomonas sp. SCSIO 73927 TaxID=3114537 RepID=UPI0030CCBED7